MLCRLLTAKSLSEPMLIYCQMDVKEHISVSSVIYIKIIKISFRKCNAKCLQNDIGFSYQSSVYWIGFRTIVFAVKIIIMDPFYEQCLALIPTWTSYMLLNPWSSVKWNYLTIRQSQPCNRWSLEWISNFIPHFTCDYLYMLGLKVSHVNKRGPRCSVCK